MTHLYTGSLVRVSAREEGLTLCGRQPYKPGQMRSGEMQNTRLSDTREFSSARAGQQKGWESLGGRLALITGATMNKLEQVLTYEITITGVKYRVLCGVAKKYLMKLDKGWTSK